MKIEKGSKTRTQRRGPSLSGAAETLDRDLASVPALIASVFGRLTRERRARLLGRLLGSVGPLALVVVGGGAFAKYLRNARWSEVPISVEDAARATTSQVYDLAHYVEQSNPHLIDALLGALLQDGSTMTALGASLAAVAINRLSASRGWGRGAPGGPAAQPAKDVRSSPGVPNVSAAGCDG